MKKLVFSLLVWAALLAPVFANNDPGDFLDFLVTDERITQNTWLNYSSDQNIVTYLHSIGMTKFAQLKDFLPRNLITRAEASKFFVKFAEQQGFARKVNDETMCTFSDIQKYQKSDLYQTMVQSCLYGLFNGSNGEFNPDGNLTNGEAIAVLIRMIEGKKLDETSTQHWALAYLEKSNDLRLILNQLATASKSNTQPLNLNISRIDMARLFEGANYRKNLEKKITDFVAKH